MTDVALDWGMPSLSLGGAAASAEEGFTPDDGSKPKQSAAGFVADSTAEFDNDFDNASDAFDGNFKPENISKHHDHDHDHDGPRDGGCRICGADGHFARDCPDKPANDGACFRCGETGHVKADCPLPLVLKCKICQADGHGTAECSNNRLFVWNNITADVPVDEAWEAYIKADQEKDLDDMKSALFHYAKAAPHVEFVTLEQAFREGKMNTYLIAKEQTISVAHTIVNLQGEPDQKYVVTLQFSAKPRRARQDEGWPADAEENMDRLGQAGFVMDSFVIVCNNCGETGHTRAKCEQDKQAQAIVVECSLCNEKGHRARDCTAPRRKVGGKECRNCGEVGHISKDCPSREARTCKRCGAEDHIAKDCDKPQDESMVTCRNCDEVGHFSKNCPKPTDWSRVVCSNCQEKGHSYKRCKAPPAVEEDNGMTGGDGGW